MINEIILFVIFFLRGGIKIKWDVYDEEFYKYKVLYKINVVVIISGSGRKK